MKTVIVQDIQSIGNKLVEWAVDVERCREIRITPVRHPMEVPVHGYEIVLIQGQCTLTHHRELWNDGYTQCPDCGLHIKGPQKRKDHEIKR